MIKRRTPLSDINFVIPALNEEPNIGSVVADILTKYPKSKVIVVDDGSIDNTGRIAAESGATVLKHIINLGQWAALKTGFIAALMNKPEIIVTLDADGQHDPKDIEKILSPILDDEADIVLGSRFIENSNSEMMAHRRIGIKAFNNILKFCTGIRVSDCTSGFKAMKVSVIKDSINMISENQYGALEFLMCLNAKGYRLIERPIKNVASDKSSKGSLKYGINLLRTILNSKYW
jgi:glycosyltransferase involved in cell wall biosynthesis